MITLFLSGIFGIVLWILAAGLLYLMFVSQEFFGIRSLMDVLTFIMEISIQLFIVLVVGYIGYECISLAGWLPILHKLFIP